MSPFTWLKFYNLIYLWSLGHMLRLQSKRILDNIQINPATLSAECSPVELGKIANPRIRGNIVTQKAECFYEKE